MIAHHSNSSTGGVSTVALQTGRQHCGAVQQAALSFFGCSSGGTLISFAMMLPLLMLLVGGAIDYSDALSERSVAQQTADAASLAGAKALSMADADKTSVAAVVDSIVAAHASVASKRGAERTYDVATKTTEEAGSPLQVEVTLKTMTKPHFGAALGLSLIHI